MGFISSLKKVLGDKNSKKSKDTKDVQHRNTFFTTEIKQHIPIMEIVINNTWESMHTKTLLRLSRTCRDINRVTSLIIENTFFLNITNNRKYKVLTPTKVHTTELKDIPTTVTHLNLNSHINYFQFLNQSSNLLPPNLTYLQLGRNFNHPLHCLPNSLTHLLISGNFTQDLDHLPHSLTHLVVGTQNNNFDLLSHPFDSPAFLSYFASYSSTGCLEFAPISSISKFSSPVDNLPPNLTHLTLSIAGGYEHSFDYLPSKLTHLSITTSSKSRTTYTHGIDYLPLSLTHLFLQCSFKNDSTHFHLPPNLTHLFWSWEPLVTPPNVEYLPPKLEYLYLSTASPNSVDHLPSSLHFLQINFYKGGLDYLPPNLSILRIQPDYDGVSLDHLPSSLLCLGITTKQELNINFDNLPSSLKKLNLRVPRLDVNLDHLPSGLTHLSIHGEYSLPLDDLPDSLQFLHVFSDSHLDYLPSSLTSLKLVKNVSTSSYYFPDSLTSLTLHDCGSIPIPFTVTHLNLIGLNKKATDQILLPPSLVHLEASGSNVPPMEFPDTLTFIKLHGYAHPIRKLPPSITYLELEYGYNHPLPELPNSLNTLIVGTPFDYPLPKLPPVLLKLVLDAKYRHNVERPTSCLDYCRR